MREADLDVPLSVGYGEHLNIHHNIRHNKEDFVGLVFTSLRTRSDNGKTVLMYSLSPPHYCLLLLVSSRYLFLGAPASRLPRQPVG